jgi:hypothetical protein
MKGITMFDPVTILLAIIALALIALVAVFWIRSHPLLQAVVDAKLPPDIDARFRAIEAALPTKADLQAEEAKLEAELAPIKAKMAAAEQGVADWLKAKGWNVSKATP